MGEAKDRALSIGAVVLAFLASQHHTIHMLLLVAAGIGSGGASAMTAVPAIRRTMLGMALAMVGVMAWQMRNPRRPRALRVMNAVSIVVTLGFAGWSLLQFGL